MTARRWAAAVATLLVALTAPIPLDARESTPKVVASRYDVTLDLQPDGSLDVVERVTLSAGDAPMSWFERRVPDRRTDGLVNVSARLDGRDADARLRVRRGINARWDFPDTSNGTRVVELRYRATRVLARELAGWRVRWNALPQEHSYPIQAARVTLRAPDGALAVALRAEGGQMQPATSWSDGLVVTGAAPGRRDGIVIDVTFSAETIRPSEPAWAVAEEHARKLAPAFIAGALAILVVGAGTLLMVRIRTSRGSVAPESGPAVDGATADGAAVATALIRNGRSGGAAMRAAFFRLVRDGALVIAPAGDRAKRFTVTPGRAMSVAGHEQWIIERARDADLARVMRSLGRGQSQFDARLTGELRERGWIDEDRASTASALISAAMVLIISSAIGAVALALWLVDALGPALLLIPLALVLDAVAFLIGAQMLSRLSLAGLAMRASWQRQLTEVRQLKTSASSSLDVFERWLPLMVGVGAGREWVKTFEVPLRERGASLPWVAAVGSGDDVAAMMATLVAVSGATHAGGVGGGAGAGGGSSSAG